MVCRLELAGISISKIRFSFPSLSVQGKYEQVTGTDHSSHHSIKAIDETKRLSVNIIDEQFLAAADYTGTVSGAKTDKSGVLPYHLGEAGMPVIEKSPLVMECEVIDTYEIDGFKNYICTILNTYVEETMLDEKGKPDYEKLKPVLFEMPTYKYLRTGDIIGDCVKMGKAYGEALK